MTDETNAPEAGLDNPTPDEGAATVPSAANNYEGIKDTSNLPASEGDEASSEANAEEQGDEALDPWAEYVEFELDGKVYKVPEALKDGYYRNKDYTQGKQQIAEQRRALEAREKDVARISEISQQEIDIRVDLVGMEKTLNQYANVDWEALEAEDFMRAQTEWRKFQQLKDNYNSRVGELTTAQKERQAIADRDLDTRIRQTADYAYKNLPGMSQELDGKITEFAIKNLGFDADTLKRSYNPQIYTMLYLAHLGHQTMSSRQTQAKTPTTAQQTKPLTVVSAKTGSSARKSLSQLAESNFEEYRAARRAQLDKSSQR